MAFTKIGPKGISAGINTTLLAAVGIQSTGTSIGVGVTTINFIGAGNTVYYNPLTGVVDVSIAGGGGSGDIIIRENFVVTNNTQTRFNLTNEYNSGLLDVYVNGIKLAQGDFSEVLPQSVDLTVSAEKGDSVEFVAFREKITNSTVYSEISQFKVTGISTFNNTEGTVHDEIRNTDLDFVFETPRYKSVSSDTVLTLSHADNVMYTKAEIVTINNNKYLELGQGVSLVLDSLQLG